MFLCYLIDEQIWRCCRCCAAREVKDCSGRQASKRSGEQKTRRRRRKGEEGVGEGAEVVGGK